MGTRFKVIAMSPMHIKVTRTKFCHYEVVIDGATTHQDFLNDAVAFYTFQMVVNSNRRKVEFEFAIER